jgi:thiol-disulfide isomerase/thioredoxin
MLAAVALLASAPTLADREIGDQVRTFFVPRLTGGDFWLKDYVGTPRRSLSAERYPLLLAFWATNCANCVKEMPYVIEAERALRGDDVRVFYVSADPKSKVSDDSLRAYIAARGWSIPDSLVLRDLYGKALERCTDQEGIPVLVLIDTGGVIRLLDKGYSPGKAETIIERVRKKLHSR